MIRNRTRSRLSHIDQNYLRADTIAAANAALITAQSRIELAQMWGGGLLASLDGLRSVVSWESSRSSRGAPNGPKGIVMTQKGSRHMHWQPWRTCARQLRHWADRCPSGRPAAGGAFPGTRAGLRLRVCDKWSGRPSTIWEV